jgi:signal transduction histidine kinase
LELPELKRRLSPDLEAAIFHIVQESLTNVHACTGQNSRSVTPYVRYSSCVSLIVSSFDSYFVTCASPTTIF